MDESIKKSLNILSHIKKASILELLILPNLNVAHRKADRPDN